MNNFRKYIIMTIILFALPIPVLADQWDKYIDFRNNFYLFDNQDFNEVTCQVSLPSLDSSWSQAKNHLKQAGSSIEFKEEFSKFKLRFNKRSGLSFEKPNFDIRQVSNKEVKNQDEVEKGISMMKFGVQQQIDGAIQILEGLFVEYMLAKKNDIQIKEFTDNGKSIKITYIDIVEGTVVEETYSGMSRHSIQKRSNMIAEANEKFKMVNGKLVFDYADVSIDQSGKTMELNTSVEYQTINNIYFPRKISNAIETKADNTSHKAVIQVILDKCEAH